MHAEALTQGASNSAISADEAVNLVRNRVGLNDLSGVTIDDVLDEKYAEFGMEWGVPEFFSLLLGGMIRWAWQHNVELNQQHLIVFIAHVQYDVLHAISVMLATSLFNHQDDATSQIKQATNILMSSRYAMMTDIYRHVFNEDCVGIDQIGLDSHFQLTDRRIAQALIEARQTVAPERVIGGHEYQQSTVLPFVFVD